MGVRFCEVVIMVKDFQRGKEFYEKLFETKINEKMHEDRWASPIPQISLINPEFDAKKNVPSGYNNVRYGNNVILTLLTDDLEKEKERIIDIGGESITKTCRINYRVPYHYFHFEDTEGNTIEIGHYPK
ncbi:VOC family protein [Brassicibacter mesophilus]|uniref:VOC family protein n=1 Tax=Brassicibacter mesophilus TaxID=745119 RepID=UPI003D242C27